MKNNIPEYVLARDIQIQPKTHDLIVASHGRGIFILDDIRPMRNLTKEIWDQDVYFFQTPDITLNNGRFGWGGPEVSGGWNTQNPPDIPSFNYYLKQRLNSGKVELEIYDDKGTLVQSMPGTIRKGINKVTWNLRGTPPKVAAGSTKMDAAGFTAPMVLPGVYTAKLKVKDKVYTSTVNCIHDAANKNLSLEDRKLIYEKSMQLQELYNNVNRSIDSISFYQALLKKDTAAFEKNKNAKAFYDDLQKVKGEFMATKKTSIFADEKRVREKVSELYGNFCGMEAAVNSTQLEAIDDLQNEYKTQNDGLNKVIAKHLPKNPQLTNPLNHLN